MSSILKALKRLEQEKAARKPDSFRVDAEILKGGTSRRMSSATVFMAVLVIFVCGGGATYLYLKTSSVSVPSPPPPSSRPEVGIETPAVPQSMPVQPPVRTTETVKTPPHPAVDRPAPQIRPIASRPRAENGKPADTPPQPVPSEAKQAAHPGPVPAGRPVLKVDGIAFQDSDVDSFAMVNGMAVSKGSVIEGARVEEIQKDRVKFSRGGERFEVILERPN